MRAAAIALLLLSLALVPPGTATHEAPDPAGELVVREGVPSITWRAVAFAPGGDHALVVGQFRQDNTSRDLIARWTPEGGLEEVYNETGAGLVDVSFHRSGKSLVVGLQDTLLLGEPGSYEDLWDDSDFAQQGLGFYGLRGEFRPGGDDALVAGSSLLRVTVDGDLEVLHGGRAAFFRALDWNPNGELAWVEAAVERDGQVLLGTIWRTDGRTPLKEGDNIQIYGLNDRGSALLNSIAFAPNGSFATLSGRDGVGASFLTWSSYRAACQGEAGPDCRDRTWTYLASQKATGPVTCLAWHPEGRYALAVGLHADVVGYLAPDLYVPLLHQGPELYGCAFHPTQDLALAVGEDGALVEVRPGAGPLARVVQPTPGSLVPPKQNATFLVGVLQRGNTSGLSVAAQAEGAAVNTTVEEVGRWWRVSVDAASLADGTYQLAVTATDGHGQARTSHRFLVNNEAFRPPTPRMSAPSDLEAAGSDADGVLTLHWQPVDAPVVYEVEERRTEGGANATRVVQAGSADQLTVRVDQDGSYLYRVRSVNSFNHSDWSDSVVVNVVLDTDGDGVPNARDPRPHVADTWGDADEDGVGDDVELRQCSDPHDEASTPATDDDGDGVPNGQECLQGSDPLDADDPTPQDDGDEPGGPDGSDPDEPDESPGVGWIALVVVVAVLAARRRER